MRFGLFGKNVLHYLVFGLLLLSKQTVAQSPDPNDIVAQLSPRSAGPVVRALKAQNALTINATAPIPAVIDLPSIEVHVAFDGSGHLLTADGIRVLRSVGVALKNEILAGQSFQVAGHFVSQEDPKSAMKVSARRAQVVAEHLKVYYGIPDGTLFPVGYGATKLADPAILTSPSNTRIQFINLLVN